jgi:hypothetical protein
MSPNLENGTEKSILETGEIRGLESYKASILGLSEAGQRRGVSLQGQHTGEAQRVGRLLNQHEN